MSKGQDPAAVIKCPGGINCNRFYPPHFKCLLQMRKVLLKVIRIIASGIELLSVCSGGTRLE